MELKTTIVFCHRVCVYVTEFALVRVIIMIIIF